jgi:histidinol-phosphate aminotransferase
MSRRFWSERAAALTPYVPGEQPQASTLLKLNTNESPWPPSPRVLEALRGIGGRDPALPGSPRRGAFARHCGASPMARRRPGVRRQRFRRGARARALRRCSHHRALLFPGHHLQLLPGLEPALRRAHYRQVALREDFSRRRGLRHLPGAVLLPIPNAPTGWRCGSAILRVSSRAPDRLLIVDEAYVDFGADSAVPLVERITTTCWWCRPCPSPGPWRVCVSALRSGRRRSSMPWFGCKDSFNSYPIDCVAERAAAAALEDREWFDTCRQRTIATRERLARALEERGVSRPSVASQFSVHTPRSPRGGGAV